LAAKGGWVGDWVLALSFRRRNTLLLDVRVTLSHERLEGAASSMRFVDLRPNVLPQSFLYEGGLGTFKAFLKVS
jgi:hypothetical protein